MTANDRHQVVTNPLTSLVLPRTKAICALAIGATLSVTGIVLAPERPYESMILAFALAWAAMVDIDRFILPDVITLGLVAAGLAFGAMSGLDDLAARAIGAIAGFAALASIAVAFRRFRGRDGLGFGDAKLAAAAGAWLGWAALPFVLIIASVAALLFQFFVATLFRRPVNGLIAFGPYIAAAIWIVWLGMPVLENWLVVI